MTRRAYIERIRRLIYGGQPPSEASITVGLVSNYLQDAIAEAARVNYIDNIKLEGISVVNNSFYTTFKSLTVIADEQFLWRITLPQIPVGIGTTDGISTLKFKDSSSNQLSYPLILLSENQNSFQRGMRPIPNKLLAYPQGEYVYVISTLLLNDYTAQVTMISGGDATDLDSTLNVPPDYFKVMNEYLLRILMVEKMQVQDVTNDGSDIVKST
jgi:hypothetical protein